MSEHSEYRIYDECGHDHREGDPGTVDVNDVGICCEDGYMYSICEKCHTRDGEQHEDSPFEQAWPCEVQQGLDKIKELEEKLATRSLAQLDISLSQSARSKELEGALQEIKDDSKRGADGCFPDSRAKRHWQIADSALAEKESS